MPAWLVEALTWVFLLCCAVAATVAIYTGLTWERTLPEQTEETARFAGSGSVVLTK